MKFLILGDVHGYWTAMNVTIAKAIRQHPDITHIVQVGDLGYGWPRSEPFKASRAYFDDEAMAIYNAAEKLWIDGNHENHDRIDGERGYGVYVQRPEKWMPDWTYMPRGSVLEVDGYRVMFFGGAASVDKHTRIEGVSWWPQENITYSQVAETLEKENGKIDALFSHEHAARIPYSDEHHKSEHAISKGNRAMLDVIVETYQPEFCFFGHHHYGDCGIVDGMEWYCCPIIERHTYTIWTGVTVQFSP